MQPLVLQGEDVSINARLRAAQDRWALSPAGALFKFPYSPIFDGTTRVCEVLNIMVRIPVARWMYNQLLLALPLLKESPNADQLCGEITTTITKYGLQRTGAVSMIHDCAEVNMSGVRKFIAQLPSGCRCLDIGCCSHTLCKPCQKLVTPLATSFGSAFTTTTYSPGSALLWKSLTGATPFKGHKIRWFANFERNVNLFDNVGILGTYIRGVGAKGFCKESVAAMTHIRSNPILHLPKWVSLYAIVDAGGNVVPSPVSPAWELIFELALTKDFGTPFCETTYILEGDDALAFFVFNHLLRLRNLQLHWREARSHPAITDVFNVYQRDHQLTALQVGPLKEKLLDLALPGFAYFAEV